MNARLVVVILALYPLAGSAQAVGTAYVRRAPTLNGSVEGSVQVMTGEATSLNSGASVSGDLRVPGTPTITLKTGSVYGGTDSGTGSTLPTGYTITVNSKSTLGGIITRIDPTVLPAVVAPPLPTGTRTVTISSAAGSIGSFSNLRDLTLNSGTGAFAIPAGTYGRFTANTGSSFVLGLVGASVPAVYNFQNLSLNSGSQIQLVGPVRITLANGISLNGTMGSVSDPAWLTLNLSAGNVTLNTGSSLHGTVNAPNANSLVTINSSALLSGMLMCDRFTLNRGGVLRLSDAAPNIAPTVSLTSPADNVIFGAPSNVVLQAAASDPDGTIVKVEFRNGTTLLGETAVSPYLYSWPNVVAGNYSVTAHATDSAGAVTVSSPIAISVRDIPLITSPAEANGQVGASFLFQISASNGPTGYTATGLPSGLSVDEATGIISGTPTLAGISAVVVSASNSGGSAGGTLLLTIKAAVPVITSAASVSGQVGVAFGYDITASNDPTYFAAAGLPAGLMVDTGTGIISGTPLQAGASNATVSASNESGSATAPLTFTILPAAPVITSAATASGRVGLAFTFQVTTSDSATMFSASNLPAGLSIDATTGVISGTPSSPGKTAVLVTATNAGGSSSVTIMLTILPNLPYIADFEASEGYTVGPLAAQLGWSVSAGVAEITLSDSFSGSSSALLIAGATGTTLTQTFAPVPGADVVFVDFFTKPAAQANATEGTVFAIEGARFAFQRMGDQGVLSSLGGIGDVGERWIPTAFATLWGADNRPLNWIRLTVRADFARPAWDLYANGRMVAADLEFPAGSNNYLSTFETQTRSTDASLDFLYVGTDNPLFADVNRNGIDDTWETAHGLSLSTQNRTDAPSGSGITVVQAYLNGTDPNDFFGGVIPTLILLGGNDQTAPGGQFNALAFQVGLGNAEGTIPLVNAPVTFSVTQGGGSLAFTNTANATHFSDVAPRTDATGLAQLYYQHAADPGILSLIKVTAGSAEPLFFRTQTHAGVIPDTDSDGLVDVWEMKWFGDLDQTGSQDPDGDGFSHSVELASSTDPTDFFNGEPATVLTVSGSGQTGLPGEFLDFPLIVKVVGRGGSTMFNAPVTFTRSAGLGGLSATFGGAVHPSLTIRTDATGIAKAFFRNETGGVSASNLIEAAVFSGSWKSSVLFTAQTPLSFPDVQHVVVNLNAGETTTRVVNLMNQTSAPVSFALEVENPDAPVEYVVKRSDEVDGPTYIWDDIREGATWIKEMSATDNSSAAIELSFAFPFYGESFNRVYINENGVLSFERGLALTDGGDSFPSIYNPANVIAPFWADLHLSTSGELYYFDDGDRAVVQYESVSNDHFDHSKVTFQVILHRTGKIDFIYKSLEGDIDDALVGLQNGDGTRGHTIQEWEDVVKSELAISMTPNVRWLTVDPLAATIPARAEQPVVMNFDATHLRGGTYNSDVILRSDYPNRTDVTLTTQLVVNTAPVAIITAPGRTRRVLAGQAIMISGMAVDEEGPIVKLELFEGATKVTESAGPDFSYQWSSGQVGIHEFTLRATDLSGFVGTSSVVTVWVDSDSDADGVGDEWEILYASRLNFFGTGDADGNGVSDAVTYAMGLYVYSTDWDGDGLTDKLEIELGFDPFKADAAVDQDGDDYPDIFEVMNGSDPASAVSTPPPSFVVDPAGNGTHSNLKAALAAAGRNFKIIHVVPGLYQGPANTGLNLENVIMIGTEGAAVTQIDGGGVNAGVSLVNSCVLKGFTIRNCSGTGVAINSNGGALVDSCVIADCLAASGGGLSVRGLVEVRSSTIVNNRSSGALGTFNGSGIRLQFGVLTLSNSVCWNGAISDIAFEYGILKADHCSFQEEVRGVGNVRVAPGLTADYHLRPDSPLRGKGGVNTKVQTDMDHEVRPIGEATDIGADYVVDRDADQLADAWEMRAFGSLVATSTGDADSDGASNLDEYLAGTNPSVDADADGDGIRDAVEIVVLTSNPLASDTDLDGLPDHYELSHGLNVTVGDEMDDSDGDGYPNAYEYRAGTDPQDSQSQPTPDLIVDPRGGAGVFTTLQAAINATTRDFQIIRVNPGTYHESVGIYRWHVMMIASEGAAHTIVDGSGIRTAVSMQIGGVMVGFHFKNGGPAHNRYGGAVEIRNQSSTSGDKAVFQNCVFSNNRAVDGGALYASSRYPLDVFIRGCTFSNNFAQEGAHGITAVSTGAVENVRVKISDSILWDEGPNEFRNYRSLFVVRDTIVRGGYVGTRVLDADPRLTMSAHLRYDSPARSLRQSSLGTDMDGERFGADGSGDIGADEFVDSDNDQLSDSWEIAYFGGLDAQDGQGDADGDGVTNGEAYVNGTTPVQTLDTDGDGLSDLDEISLYHSDPTQSDTDRDGIWDNLEVQHRLEIRRDDGFEDLDGDGYPNAFEAMRGSDPHLASSSPSPDYTVAVTGTRSHATIRAAVEAANTSGQNFRIILVSPGTYSVGTSLRVNFATQRTLLISAAGAAQTFLDGGRVEANGAALGLNTNSVVHGFTIRGVYSRNDGGAFRMATSAMVSHCVVRDNRAYRGAVAVIASGRSSFVHCTLINNVGSDSASSFAINALSTLELSNSIVWNPASTPETKGDGIIVCRNSIFRGLDPFGGGINVDPLATADGHLRIRSPARAAGRLGAFPLLDMDGESRRPGDVPDIGADQFSASAFLDADEDGMVDSWESDHGLNPLLNDAYADADNDGVANVHEASHLTNPNDPASLPQPDFLVDGSIGAADPSRGVFATLAEAVAAITQPFQIIGVRRGVYTGGVTLAGLRARGILIRSMDGAPFTVIDGQGINFGLAISTEASLEGLTFAHCTGDSGGALTVDASNVRITNCVFRDNHAVKTGAALYTSNSEVDLTHTTLFRNRTDANEAGRAISVSLGRMRVLNSIIWDLVGAASLSSNPPASLSVQSSILPAQGGYLDGGGNLTQDPLLSPHYGHLSGLSPAIDVIAGFASGRDMEGDLRPIGQGADVGADEYLDSDGDRLNDGWERAVFGDLTSTSHGDSDGDGLTNGEELLVGTNPLEADTDGDGLDDHAETRLYHTDPRKSDTDGDETADGAEIEAGLDPLQRDADLDTDGDGLPNALEIQLGTRPDNKDSDGDGLLDGLERPEGFDPLVNDYVGLDQTPPPPPVALAITSVTPNTVGLSWSPGAGELLPVSYSIWRNGRLIERTSDLTFTDQYGEPGVYPFVYHLTAADADGNESVASERLSGSTAAGFSSLPGDADGDAIPDPDDSEPNNPANAFRDDDGDSIPNRDDPRPTEYDGPPPTVKILNNDDKVSYLANETMRLTVRVSDPKADVVVYRNDRPIGAASWKVQDIFEFAWTNLPIGVHHVRVVVKDAKRAVIATKTFIVDVAEVEAHITFVGPDPAGGFGKNYSILTQIDGSVVERPILRNTVSLTSGIPADLTQPTSAHYERYYRGRPLVTIYEGERAVAAFKIPPGEKYPLVIVRELRSSNGELSGVKTYVVNPSVPAAAAAMVKVANFSASDILGGFTKYYLYTGEGGPDENDLNQGILAQTRAVTAAMYSPTTVTSGAVTDVSVPGERGYMSFYQLGDWALRWRAHPEPPHEYPTGMLAYSPEWWAWYRLYGNMIYQYVSLNGAGFSPNDRALYCYYRESNDARGLRWSTGLPILPEIRITPFNRGSVEYPGGRGHPMNNLSDSTIFLQLNDDSDEQLGVPDYLNETLGANDDDLIQVNVKIDLRGRTDVTTFRLRLPVGAGGEQILRGFYRSGTSFAVLPVGEVNWSLAEHPELTSDAGLNFYFEGLNVMLAAKIEVDVLTRDDRPVNRVYPTQGKPETLVVNVLPLFRLMVDNNRDGMITSGPEDATTASRPFRFWVNDDIDRSHTVDGDDTEEDDLFTSPNGKLDWDDDQINSKRDLEDLARLKIYLNGLQDAITQGAVKVGLQWKPAHESTGSPSLKVWRNLSPNGGTEYLSDETVAQQHLNLSSPGLVQGRTPYFIPTQYWTNVELSAAQPYGNLLFEGCTVGKGQLVISLHKPDGTEIGERLGEWIELKSIEEFYERWTAGDGNGGDPSATAKREKLISRIGNSVSYGPGFEYPADAPEENKYILYVHGWNMQPEEKNRFAETAFKRLYWQGYKGRFGVFCWPATYNFGVLVTDNKVWKTKLNSGYSASTDPTNYDRSEWTAWKSSFPLMQLLNGPSGLRSTYPSVNVMAHSMGNIVIGEALRRLAHVGTTNVIDCYVASQAALPAHSYDGTVASDLLADVPLATLAAYSDGGHPETPNIYPTWLAENGGAAGRRVNFYNVNDFALWHDSWEANQFLKPDGLDDPDQPWTYKYVGEVNVVQDLFKRRTPVWSEDLHLGDATIPQNRYEIMAFAAEARSRAVGAKDSELGMDDKVDLQTIWPDDTGRLGSDGQKWGAHKWHSAQFRSTIMRQGNYWKTLLGPLGFNLSTTP